MMPGTTPNYAIPFPCAGDPLNPAAFQSLALGVDNALLQGDAAATAATHEAQANLSGQANPAVGVEAIVTFDFLGGIFNLSNGITINAAAGTATVVFPGLYGVMMTSGGSQSTLTMTSQRMAVYVNGVLYAAKKLRGFNPAFVQTLSGSVYWDVGPLVLGDVITLRWVWTGTGALTSAASFDIAIAFLGSP